MADISRRRVWGLGRCIRRHQGETGVVVYAWFLRFKGWPLPRKWFYLHVTLDDGTVGSDHEPFLHRTSRGPKWMGVSPGEHVIHFHGPTDLLRSQTVRLGQGEVVLLGVKPAVWVPFRGMTKAQWLVRGVDTQVH